MARSGWRFHREQRMKRISAGLLFSNSGKSDDVSMRAWLMASTAWRKRMAALFFFFFFFFFFAPQCGHRLVVAGIELDDARINAARASA